MIGVWACACADGGSVFECDGGLEGGCQWNLRAWWCGWRDMERGKDEEGKEVCGCFGEGWQVMIGVRCEVDVGCAVMVDVNDAIEGSCDGCRVDGIGVNGFGHGWY